MWTFCSSNDNVVGLAGAAILFNILVQHGSARYDELGAATLCWMILPLLFKVSTTPNSPLPIRGKQSAAEAVSSRSLWIMAVSFASFVIMHAGTGLLDFYVSNP